MIKLFSEGMALDPKKAKERDSRSVAIRPELLISNDRVP